MKTSTLPTNTPQKIEKLGQRMKQLRLKKGYTSLEKFAFDHNISRVLYSNYESGKGNITFKNLVKTVDALGVSLKEFFSEGF